MNYLEQIPAWARSAFSYAGLNLKFEEQKMDCRSCSFAQGDHRDESQIKEVYKASLKCCTFFPDLPNFTVGRIFKESASAQVTKLNELLGDESIALLSGFKAPQKYKQAYASAVFGQEESLLCPYFDRVSLNCGIWSSRGSSCVRFVCKSSLGEQGQEVWSETERALSALEENLSYEAALQMGFTNDEILKNS